jgi:hypothetical protein
MKANQLFVVLTALTTGCGAVQSPATTGDDDAGSGSGSGELTGVFSGSVLDERNDVIDFSTQAPVHTHGGAPIDLGGAGCPAIYKYAYLEGAHAPQFGSETTPNPLAWHIKSDVAALDPIGTAYRVRDEAGHLLVDWTAMNPDGDGSYTIDLRRDTVPKIGTQASRMYVDARFRDTAGMESIKTACWDNHPLAAPLQIAAPTSGDLFGMSFASHSYISRVMNAGSFDDANPYGPIVAEFLITQPTSEPTELYLTAAAPTGTGTKDVVDEFVAVASFANTYDCGLVGCAVVAAPVVTTGSSPIDGVWRLSVVDISTYAVVCSSSSADRFNVACSIPARTGDPHLYAATLQLSGERSIAPTAINLSETTFQDQLIGGKWVSGTADNFYTVGCSAYHRNATVGPPTYTCTQSTDYKHVSAANSARIDFDAIQFTAKAAAGDATTAQTLPYLPPLVLPAQTWDAGSAGM